MSQFGSDTPWAKAVASKAAEDAKPKSGTSGNDSQFGSNTPWAKAVEALTPAKTTQAQGHYGPPEPPKQAQGHYGPPAPPKQADTELKSTTVSATPNVPQNNNVPSFTPPPPIKTATPDIILFDEEAVPIEVMSDLIFENIGGQELISIVRSDIVNGQKIIYQPIKNLPSIQQQYNPNNILGLQQTSDKYFAGFSIKLEEKIPNQGNGIDGKNVYLEENGDLIIEFVNLNDDEEVETQITLNGTIYEANLEG
jgi:hypothetical protein